MTSKYPDAPPIVKVKYNVMNMEPKYTKVKYKRSADNMLLRCSMGPVSLNYSGRFFSRRQRVHQAIRKTARNLKVSAKDSRRVVHKTNNNNPTQQQHKHAITIEDNPHVPVKMPKLAMNVKDPIVYTQS